MAIDVEKVVGQNIVLVYDRLDGQALNRNELRQLVEGETTPTVIDAPEMIVVVKPPLPIVVQIEEASKTWYLDDMAISLNGGATEAITFDYAPYDGVFSREAAAGGGGGAHILGPGVIR